MKLERKDESRIVHLLKVYPLFKEIELILEKNHNEKKENKIFF